MADVPDIGNMSPDTFLSQLQKMRTDLVDAMEGVLRRGDAPEATAADLRDLFDEFALGDDQAEPTPLVDVESAEDGELLFSRQEAETPIRLERREGRWRLTGDHSAAAEDLSAEELALEILKLVPWWSEGAFVERVGHPEQAAGRSLTDQDE